MPSPWAHPGTAFPVLSRFFAFWEEVEAFRREVRPQGEADDGFLPASARGREQLAEALRNGRAGLLRSTNAAALAQHDQAEYVMAATADELFIGLDWDGANDWRLHPLEAELFGTRRAGQEIFARIERLVDGADPFDADMAAVYLTALELGFKGRFADAVDRQTLDTYEAELRKLVGRAPRVTSPLVPQCYENTSVAGSGRRLPGSRIWWRTAVAIVGVCLVAAVLLTATWFHETTIERARRKLEASFGLLDASR